MRAKIRYFDSPDVDLDEFSPVAGEPFLVLIEVLAGPAEGTGEESFGVEVCNIEWLQQRLRDQPEVELTQTLLVARWDYEEISGYLKRRIEDIEGRDWEQLGLRIGKIGKWEFEDYDPAPTWD